MEVQKGWGVRLTNISQGLDVLVRIDEERRELRVEFEERVLEKKGESSRRRSGLSSPLPEEDFCFACGAKGLPKEHKCEEITSLLASVVGRLESDGRVDERDGEKTEKIASFEGTSSNQ
ncbi:hypothetical protein R1flu_016676 [Riccia fluitans]|uniref:Uncharacterized protein n=1 Tax=Riccia fluitans TaxID=41844 RepID=A0ABD1YNC9_9MARC